MFFALLPVMRYLLIQFFYQTFMVSMDPHSEVLFGNSPERYLRGVPPPCFEKRGPPRPPLPQPEGPLPPSSCTCAGMASTGTPTEGRFPDMLIKGGWSPLICLEGYLPHPPLFWKRDPPPTTLSLMRRGDHPPASACTQTLVRVEFRQREVRSLMCQTGG